MQRRRRRTEPRLGTAMLAWLTLAAACPAGETDWPRWRGPNGDGISTEKQWQPAALRDGPKIKWRVEVGAGYSAVAIKGPHLFTLGNVDHRDIVYGLEPDSGKEVWRFTYDCAAGNYAGPRATPAVDGNRVYTFSREGDVFCLDAKRGSKLWHRDLIKDPDVRNVKWGVASSPCVLGNLVLLNAGAAGAALDKATGKTVWASKGQGGYAVPVPYTLGGTRGAVFFSRNTVCGVEVATGKVRWSFPWETRYDVNAADPLVAGDRVFVSSGYDRGCALLSIADPEPKVLWQNTLMRNHFSSCLLIDGFIYGIDGNAGNGALRCLRLETGEEQWAENLGFGTVIAADGKLIVLNERGGIFIAEARPDGYHELARAEAAVPVDNGAKCWTVPVLCRGLLYCRNSAGTLVCVDLRG